MDRYTGQLQAIWYSNKLETDKQIAILRKIHNYFNNPVDGPPNKPVGQVDVICVEENGIGNGVIPFIRRMNLPLYTFASQGGSHDHSKYLNFITVLRAIELGILEGDAQLYHEVTSLKRSAKGKFSGDDDIICAIAFALVYINKFPQLKPRFDNDPNKFNMDKWLKPKNITMV